MPVRRPAPSTRDEAVVSESPLYSRVDALNRQTEEQLTIDPKRACDLALESHQLAEQCGYVKGRAAALYNQGMAEHLQSNYEPALALLRSALEIYERQGGQSEIARALRALGFVYDDLGDYSRALDYHLGALTMDGADRNDPHRADSLRTVGIIYSKAGNHEQGRAYYRQSLELSRKAGDQLASAKTLNNIGINLKNLGRYNESLDALTESLSFFRETGNQLGQAGTLNNLGITLSLLERTQNAETALQEALDISRQSSYLHGEMNALLSLGRLCTQHQRLPEALESLQAALACAERMKAKPALNECHEALAQLYKQMGDSAKALEHFEAFHALEREVFNEQSDRKLQALQISFQFQEALREGEIHRLRNVDLATAYEELRSLHQSLQLADQVKTELVAQLEKQNQEDGLTGLSNRRYLDGRLAEEFRRAQRHRHPLSVALADIDFFKSINDRLSHGVGDETLKELAFILRANCRDTDVVARYGGEEFAIVLLEMDGAGAARVCEKIRKAVETHDWERIHPDLKVTLSIGVTDDVDVENHEKLLAAADAKLYQAKAMGRNKVCC